jgi:hypothetical protein
MHANPSVAMSPLVACLFPPILSGADPSVSLPSRGIRRFGDSAMRHQAVYSGVRQYLIHNFRFDKSASVEVRMPRIARLSMWLGYG